jgi:hypothetical protein
MATSNVPVILKKEVVDSLEENVTCSQCKKVPRNATISWCTEHHLMCQTCYDSLSGNGKKSVRCGPDCQVDSKPGLSPFVANVLKELPTQCKFTPNGCQVIIVLKNLEVHEVTCVYRVIKCPFLLRCRQDETVTFIGLGEHLEAKHKDLRKIGKSKSKDFVLASEEDKWFPQELTFCNRSFFTCVKGRFNEDANKDLQFPFHKFFCMLFHGTPEEAAHYSYRLKIIGENGNKLTFESKVISLDDDTYIGKKNPEVDEGLLFNHARKYFFLHAFQEKLLQVDGQINFEFSIYSDKEEIKNEDVESGISDDDDDQ